MADVASELAEAVIGALFAAIGAGAAVAGLSARPERDRASIWFGIFCLLYGVRLAAKSTLVQLVLPWPAPVFHYIDAFVTYTILIPAGLFVESLVGPGWRHLIRRTWQITCVYAAAVAIYELVRGQPYATMWLNPPIVLFTLILQSAHLVARVPRGPWSREVRAVVAAGAGFTLVAGYETLNGRGLLGRGFDTEPFAMLIFTAALGWFVITRARDQAYGFVALSRELELARAIQQSLLPLQMPAVPGLRLHGAYLPMSAVAGDFYDVAHVPGGRLAVIVADVSGHGMPAALVASMVKVAFAAESERYDRPGDILGGINRALTGTFDRAYITACCAIFDPGRETLAYAAAGHPPGVLRRHDGRLERLDHGGIMLTVMPSVTYSSVDVPFHPGDRLLLFTDGLLEASRGEDDFFGDAELARVVAATPPSADISQAVLGAHRQWIGADAPLADDVTLVVVDCVAVGSESGATPHGGDGGNGDDHRGDTEVRRNLGLKQQE